jgi:hypothetical protein
MNDPVRPAELVDLIGRAERSGQLSLVSVLTGVLGLMGDGKESSFVHDETPAGAFTRGLAATLRHSYYPGRGTIPIAARNILE